MTNNTNDININLSTFEGITIIFHNEDDLLYVAKLLNDAEHPKIIWNGFYMASKNSALRKESAAIEYFDLVIKKKGFTDSDFDHLSKLSSNYKVIMGRMIHNYTFLSSSLTFTAFASKASDNDYILILTNSYKKLGQAKYITRSERISDPNSIKDIMSKV